MARAYRVTIGPVTEDEPEPDPVDPDPWTAKVLTVSDFQPNGSLSTPMQAVATAVRAATAAADCVFMAGDLAYNGVVAEYNLVNGASMYGPVITAGKLRPAPGNHDYYVSNAANYDAMLTTAGVTHEPAGGGPPYYYAFDVGPWRLYALDVQDQQGYPTSFQSGSAQYTWLSADLAANPRRPKIAYWHSPRWDGADYSNDANVAPVWQLLHDNACDIVVSGHDHSYQRFTRLSRDGSGGYPTAAATGMREWVCATGGYGLRAVSTGGGTPDPNSTLQAWSDELLTGGASPGTTPSWCGYLELTLTSTSYSWRFLSHNGAVKDSGGPVGTRAAGPVGNPTPTEGSGWVRTFTDDFTGAALDTSRWVAMNGSTNNNMSSGSSASYVAVHDGAVWLRTNGTNSGAQLSSDPLDGAGANGYTVPVGGFAEARVWFPGESGDHIYNWPAWWTSGRNWPTNGELDIAEGLGGDLAIVYHYGNVGQDLQRRASDPSGTWYNGWHTYGVHRKESTADYYYDGVLKATLDTSDLGGRHAMILTCGPPGGRTAVTGDAGALRVDYVRAWEPQ